MIPTSELEGYLEEFIEEKIEIKNLTKDTIKKKIFNIKKFIEWLKDTDVEELNEYNTKRCLRKYRSYCLNDRKNKRTSVKTYLLNIIDFLNYDEVQRLTQYPTINIKDIIDVKMENPETARKRIEKISLTKEQVNFFLDTIRIEGDVRDYAICKTFFDSGMRLKELVLLDKTDIKAPINSQGFYILPDDPNEIIEVHLRAEITKGQYKDRTTFITYDTLSSINQMIMSRIVRVRKENGKKRIRIRQDRIEYEKHRKELFTTTFGTRFHRRGVQDIIKKYAIKCDERIEKEHIDCPINFYKNVSVHILRHTALSHYAEILTVAEVQSIAGHSSNMTTDKYIHVDYSQMKEKIKNKMEAIK